MVNEQMVHIVVPVKDSIETAEKAIRAIVASGHKLCVYDDFSTDETVARLNGLKEELGIEVVHLSEHIATPSPNYRWVLIDAQRRCLAQKAALVIVESDVIVGKDTIAQMTAAVNDKTGMVAAVTHDEQGQVNFPYEYAKNKTEDFVCTKRLSFCCTLLSPALLKTIDFANLDPEKNWYDVHISRQSRMAGFENILQVSNPVLHIPHSSRPWKRLKYTNPLLYYWRKWTQGKDQI